MAAIEACRTAALGGHVEQCDRCGETRVAYNSCRNRHCPKCQGLARLQWLADRQAELLPIPYFHVVFTVPAPVAAIALQNKAVVYDILFKAAAETIRTIGADPKHLGAETGMIAILHTWGQTLTHHPHVHCIVPGGGIGPDGRFITCRPGFFLPVRVLSRLYRRLFLERLQAAFEAGDLTFFSDLARLREPSAFGAHIQPLRSVEWVVYAKRPFGGPRQVLDYLGRYTHRVALANSRLLACENGRVRFRWKDHRARHKGKAPLWTVIAGLMLIGVILVMLSPRSPTRGNAVELADVKRVLGQRCLGCHAEKPTFPGLAEAPKGVKLDTPERIEAMRRPIHQQTVLSRAMPPANVTGMTDAERALLDRWARIK